MPIPRPSAHALAWLLGAALLAGCSSNQGTCLPSGECAPTVEGVAPAGFPDAQAAAMAFTRASKDGAFQAVLEDVAWLRFEGDEEAVLRQHRAYFEQGYTTFSVTLMTKEFTQPTAEVFLLTDSRGGHLMGKPITYNGVMGQENERFAARFQVSFRHAITRELDWVRLKRLADGAELEWIFPWAPKAAPGAAAPAPTGTAQLAPATPQNLLKARNPEPAPVVAQGGRPVNLLNPGAAQPASFAPPTAPAAFPAPAASVAPATFPAPTAAVPPSASLGEPVWSEPPPPPAPAHAAPAPSAAPAASVVPVVPATPGALPPPAIRRR